MKNGLPSTVRGKAGAATVDRSQPPHRVAGGQIHHMIRCPPRWESRDVRKARRARAPGQSARR